jgi:NTE family protein
MNLRSIALGGGGSRGILHVGALRALQEWTGELHFPDGVYGSSIGAVFATAIAFGIPLDAIRRVTESSMTISRVLPSPTLDHALTLTTRKGLFPMTTFESTILSVFQEVGLDLRGKRCRDAKVPLYIAASNMTTQRTTVFSGTVPILRAIQCSSCLPLVFVPQVLYNQVYLDGGVLLDSLGSLVPSDCLVVHISATAEPLFPSDIADISLATYIHRVYRGIRTRPVTPNTLWLSNTTVGLLQEMTLEQKRSLVDEGLSQTRAFLSKRRPKKLE